MVRGIILVSHGAPWHEDPVLLLQSVSPSALLTALALVAALPIPAPAEDGYELWLRHRPLADAALRGRYRPASPGCVIEGSPTRSSCRARARAAPRGPARAQPLRPRTGRPGRRRSSPARRRGSPLVASLDLAPSSGRAGDEGFVLRSTPSRGHRATVIAANRDVGVLYGVFRAPAAHQTGQRLDALALVSAPRLRFRLLDHWDNLNRTVERGYAGFSLWDWHKLPGLPRPALHATTRAPTPRSAINGDRAQQRQRERHQPHRGVARQGRGARRRSSGPTAIRVYLTARFSAPIEIGGLKTADPLDPAVAAWWKRKADEIYGFIPDFGGFLVKANSEGQPGPQDYERTHAEGANVLADALAPHGGLVMWRAFVYSNEVPDDRAKQAYNEFKPLDGPFRPNVLVQVKNGPIDFQPREPFHPLFGAMPKTPLMMEFQITQEYLGFATHLVYLGAALRGDAARRHLREGRGLDGREGGRRLRSTAYALTGMAGVANVGTDRNWCGSVFACANWYALRPPGLGPRPRLGRDRRRVDPPDVRERPRASSRR